MGASSLDETAQLLQLLLLYGLLPLWLLAGVGDWALHRWQRIEYSAGWRESVLHLLMVSELAVGVLAVLLLQITAPVLVFLLIVCIAHEITVWRDLAYAATRRRIPVPEQWVHALQIVLPWAALVVLALIHRDQTLALLGLTPADAEWTLRRKDPPLPWTHVAGVLTAGAVMVGLPFVEELLRCLAARRGRVGAPPVRSETPA